MGSTYSYNKLTERYGVRRLRIGELNSLKCKRNIGSIIIRDDGYCLDQISDENNVWFYNKSRYLMKRYGITVVQYYNICIYGSASRTPVCKYCGKDLRFRELNYGYYPTCGCRECKRKHRSEGPWLRTENMREITSKSITRYNNEVKWKDKSLEEKREINKNWRRSPGKSENPYFTIKVSKTRRIKCMSRRLSDYLLSRVANLRYDEYKFHKSSDDISKFTMNSFATRGNPEDICSFYIATLSNNRFKFGVTSKGYGRKSMGNYKNMKILINSDRVTISLLEYHIKKKLSSSKEVMNWKDTYKFRSAYIESMKLLGLFKFND